MLKTCEYPTEVSLRLIAYIRRYGESKPRYRS